MIVLVAVRLADGERVEAQEARRGCVYICPDIRCRRRVYLKKPLLRVDHFAHEPGANCAASHGETPEHLRAKDFLLKAFRSRGMRVAPEVVFEILKGEDDRRADVVVYGPKTGEPVAFEAQHSMLELRDIIRRTASYFAGGVPVIWLALLKPKRVARGYRARGANINCVRRYTVNAWERWAHNFSDEAARLATGRGRGHLWFMDPSTGLMWRAWFTEVVPVV